MTNKKLLAAPKWAGRVPKWKIARLYEDDAKGMHDEALLNDIGFTLLARCKSMLMFEQARNGMATCPVCEAMIEHAAQKGVSLECSHCGWQGSWDQYRASVDGLHLIAPGLQPFCREYIRKFPQAKTSQDKMFWIDWLIHRCHWEGTALPGQPGAASLIQGRARDVTEFLDALSAGTHRSPAPHDLGAYWSAAEKATIKKWRQAAKRRQHKRAREQERHP